MSATARQPAATVEPGVDPVYTSRDDLAQSFNPANAYERMLVTAAAQAWQRLQRAYDLERRLLETTDPLELFNSGLDRFKTIARHIAECDRIWRRSLEALERVQRTGPAAAQARTASPRRRPLAIAPVPHDRTPGAAPSAPAAAATRASPSRDSGPAELLKLT